MSLTELNQNSLSIVYQALADLKPRAANPRTHSKKQVAQIANAIRRFGFTNPVLVDDANGIIAGHGRVEAAKTVGLDQVPTVRLSAMSEAEVRAYVIADNRSPKMPAGIAPCSVLSSNISRNSKLISTLR